ncbi:MAG TPA: tail fiber domain-containing protein [Chthoniobacterales bacterium]|jgi:uncharacterized coiled-coil protein SlyX
MHGSTSFATGTSVAGVGDGLAVTRVFCRRRLRLLLPVNLLFATSFGCLAAVSEATSTNTFVGDGAGANISTGTKDSGFGYYALNADTTGSTNTAIGESALLLNKTGSHNTGTGTHVLHSNISGDYNTAIGHGALYSNVSGSYNTALGTGTLFQNTGSYNIAFGYFAGANITSGNYNINIRTGGLADDSYGIRLGLEGEQVHAYMAGIYPVTLVGLPVRVSSGGKLAATILSSAQFKEDIQPMEKLSEVILSLRPVTFRYKKELDPGGTRQFGLVAEDVAKVDPDLIMRDSSGQPHAVCYGAINALLLNEFLKTHHQAKQESRETEELGALLNKLQSTFAAQEKALAALSNGVQKMSNELAWSKPTVRLVGGGPPGAVGNTSIGLGALDNISSGYFDSAFGANALFSDTTGSYNTASGCKALYSNEDGSNNTAAGREALYSNHGDENTAVGAHSLYSNDTGENNTAGGKWACYNNTSGSANAALGYQAGYNLTNGAYNIDIGNTGLAGESKTTRIGDCARHTNAYMAGVHDALTLVQLPLLYVDSNCHLGIKTSSARFKEDIEPMGKASEVLLSLRPVTFRYKRELDPHGGPQFGLVAEEVAKVEPDLVVRDAAGQPYGVRYEAVEAMLLNEFIKTHRQVETELDKQKAQAAAVGEVCATLAQRRKQIATLRRNEKELRKQLAEAQPSTRPVVCTPPTTDNTFCGDGAGAAVTIDADCDSGFGHNALHSATSADYATAIGNRALSSNTSGSNVALGNEALTSTKTSLYNTGVGARALYKNTGGTANTAIGRWALNNNVFGSYNVALGERAGYNTTGSYNIDIGNEGAAGESNTIRIGTEGTQIGAFMAGIYTDTVTNGLPVVVDSEGHLGTSTSSARFKENIRPMEKRSETILALRPVTFFYHNDLDPSGGCHPGLVAEEVAKVDPDLVVRDTRGKPYTVRYEAVDAMVLNEFLKLHRAVEKEVYDREAQELTIQRLRFGLSEQKKQITSVRAQIQTIHLKLEVHKVAARVLASN